MANDLIVPSPEPGFDINKIVSTLIAETAKTAVKNAGSVFSSGVTALSDTFTSIYKDYLTATYRKVSTIKTFVNPQKPVDLYRNFVTLNLKNGSNQINEIELIDSFAPGARLVISALAGRGKSVLMKYVALSKYHNPSGTIPLFLELRQLNTLGVKNILIYLHNSYKGSKRLSYEKFQSYLIAGVFSLILDGFDELDPDIRNDVEAQVLSIAHDYPRLAMIISGRPDEKFNSWSYFTHYTILPMTLPQVEKLVNLLEYDSAVKTKFIRQVKTKLFKTHQSFLSTPLLATLMLLTFEQYADIPDNIHLFYDNAFETLFLKHDASKETYIRKTKSGLSVDIFRKVFSAFSAISYSERRFAFSREQIVLDLAKSISYVAAECSADDLLSDLVESVCLIQLEGFEYSFVHRSFQEYFCALFIANTDRETRNKFLSESWIRPRDSVVTMLFDMIQKQSRRSGLRILLSKA